MPREILALDEHASVWEETLSYQPQPAAVARGGDLDRALAAMGNFADLISPYLAGHSAAVAELAAASARICRIDEAGVAPLRHAALVHDLGRVAIHSRIWEKPGPLNADEWEQVRLHPYYTERVLARSEFLAALAPVAGAHHERLDGSGYSRGATGAELTLPARLLAAADAYCAMTAPRPHREPLPAEQAADELAREASAGRLDADAVIAVVDAAGQQVPRLERPAGLTEREARVVGMLARGMQTKQVAGALGISTKTADHHIQNAYRKIGVSTRAAATLFAMEHGLVAWENSRLSGQRPARSVSVSCRAEPKGAAMPNDSMHATGEARELIRRVRTAAVDGAALAYREQGEGEPVVFVHGSADDLRSLGPASSRRSAPPTVRSPTAAATRGPTRTSAGADNQTLPHVNDLVTFLQMMDAAPAHLVGHSWGGLISFAGRDSAPAGRAQSRAPGAARAFALLTRLHVLRSCSGFSFGGRGPRVLILSFAVKTAFARREGLPAGERRGGDAGYMPLVLLGKDHLGAASTGAQAAGAREPEHTAGASARSGFPPLSDDDVRGVSAPTLLMTGERSPAYLPRLTDRLEQLLPNAERVEIAGASHLMSEENTQRGQRGDPRVSRSPYLANCRLMRMGRA